MGIVPLRFSQINGSISVNTKVIMSDQTMLPSNIEFNSAKDPKLSYIIRGPTFPFYCFYVSL